jgi:multiple antibiotic resistance protein
MATFWHDFVMTFIPLFIVVDAFGNLPFVIAMSQPLDRKARHKLVHFAIITATIVGLVFLFFGQFILDVMNISVGSFAIAGGIILVVLSIKYMTTGHMIEANQEELMAIVPIGTPLTVGPATITALILLATQYRTDRLCRQYGRRMDHLHVEQPIFPLPGQGWHQSRLTGVQPFTGGYWNKYGTARTGFNWHYN